MNHSEKMRK